MCVCVCAAGVCAAQGCTAIICMPVNTPDIKVQNVRRLGGVVELVGESYQEAQAYAQVRGAFVCGGVVGGGAVAAMVV